MAIYGNVMASFLNEYIFLERIFLSFYNITLLI